MKLYDYAYSSAAYRVRIAMNMKGIAYDRTSIHLVKDGGQQHSAAYKAVNPQELIPSLEVDGHVLGQSLAIIEYLDETHPAPPLLPTYPLEKARVRNIAYAIACDIHPINNLRARARLKEFGHAEDEIMSKWYAHWITVGFTALETHAGFVEGDRRLLSRRCADARRHLPRAADGERLPLQGAGGCVSDLGAHRQGGARLAGVRGGGAREATRCGLKRKHKREGLLVLEHFLPYRLSVLSNTVSGRIAKSYEERFQLDDRRMARDGGAGAISGA